MQKKNKKNTHFEEGSSSHTSLRDGSEYQNLSLSLEIMCTHSVISGPHSYLHICNHIHYKKLATKLSENEGGGSKAVWKLSENSSDLVALSSPKRAMSQHAFLLLLVGFPLFFGWLLTMGHYPYVHILFAYCQHWLEKI